MSPGGFSEFVADHRFLDAGPLLVVVGLVHALPQGWECVPGTTVKSDYCLSRERTSAATAPLHREEQSERSMHPSKTVLIIDHDPDLLEVTSFALKGEGFGVETARHGDLGLLIETVARHAYGAG
jgi:hypothetical protein